MDEHLSELTEALALKVDAQLTGSVRRVSALAHELAYETDAHTLLAVFRTEGAALSFIKARVAKGTVVHAHEASAWNELHSRFEMKRINLNFCGYWQRHVRAE